MIIAEKILNQRIPFFFSCLVDHTLLLDDFFLLLFYRFLLFLWLLRLCCGLLLLGLRLGFLWYSWLLWWAFLFWLFDGSWLGGCLLGGLFGKVVLVVVVIDLNFKLFRHFLDHIDKNIALGQEKVNGCVVLCWQHVRGDHGESFHNKKITCTLFSNYRLVLQQWHSWSRLDIFNSPC